MARRPLVALTTYAPNDAGRVSLPADYHEAVRRAGGLPLLVPPAEIDPVELLEAVDALVLTGGGDVDPGSFGGRTHPAVYGTDLARDALELALVDLVVDRGFPTLAICRGMQVLNVALGGDLHPHLPDVVDGRVTHRGDPGGAVAHLVELEAGSLVGTIMGATTVEVQSLHHQAVDRLGRGLAVVGCAADGVVEAVELADHPFLAAVQWHPETSAATDSRQQALFDALVQAAR
jgi:putative glutamine amidotransferase